MKLRDILAPKGDTLQMRLKKKGKPVSGVYVDDKQEFRSPDLPKPEDKTHDR